MQNLMIHSSIPVLLAATNGGVNEVEVGFGVKYSTVHGKVLPAPDLREKSCPFMAPFPIG